METAKSPVFPFEKECVINEPFGLCLPFCCWLAKEAASITKPIDVGKIFLRRADDDYRVNIFKISSLLKLIAPAKKEMLVLTNESALCDKVEYLADFINHFSLQKMRDFTQQEFSEIFQKIKTDQ